MGGMAAEEEQNRDAGEALLGKRPSKVRRVRGTKRPETNLCKRERFVEVSLLTLVVIWNVKHSMT